MTAVANNLTQFVNAVADMDIDYIFLAFNITLTSGITIPPTKPSLIIDGTYEEVIHSFTDMNSSLATDTIGIQAESSNISLTFQNMNMTGRNYYGIPYIRETLADTSGVSVTYRNITYTGPQLVHNPMGLTHFENCTITTNLQEIGEVCRVEFSGVNTITHTGTSNAAFWFRGNVNTAYFRVLPDASVQIRTANYFMYNLVPAALPTTQNPVVYDIQSGASLTIESNHGLSMNTNHRISSFLVDTNASFRYIQETANGTNASLYLNGSFTVNEGASVYMQANFVNARSLINFIASTMGTALNINRPKSFVLYNSSYAPVSVTSPVVSGFSLYGAQINYWNTATPLTQDAGGFNDTPDDKWFRPNWGTFDITGNITSTMTNISGTSLTADEQSSLPPVGNLVFQNARVISVGNLPVSPDLMANDGRAISGTTEPGANIIVEYAVEGTGYSFTAEAQADGRFSIDPQMIIPAGTIVTVKANVPFLITVIEEIVSSAVNEIIIQRAPYRITFRLPPISTDPVILTRFDPLEPVEILDLRSVRTSWNLLASITGDLEAATGDILERAVVFRGDDGVLRELTEEPIVVYTGEPAEGQTDVFWTEENGILVRIDQPVRSGVAYTTQVIWQLETI